MAELCAVWDDWTSIVARELSALPWGWFLIVDVDVEPTPGPALGPYTQVSRYAGGFHCEAVSQTYLPAESWPVDEQVLRADGWCPPDEVADNWWQTTSDVDHAAVVMIRSLVLARGCADPERLTLSKGQHPDPPGDKEPLPADVISIHAALAA